MKKINMATQYILNKDYVAYIEPTYEWIYIINHSSIKQVISNNILLSDDLDELLNELPKTKKDKITKLPSILINYYDFSDL